MASQTKLNLSNTKFEQTSGSTLNLNGNLSANSFSASTFNLISVPQVGTSGDTILARSADGGVKNLSQQLFMPRLLEKRVISGATYTLTESDSSKLLIFLNECVITLPNSIPEDLQFTAANYSTTGVLTFNAESVLNSADGNLLEGQYSHAFFYKRNATTWVGILPGEGGTSSGTTGLQASDIDTLAELNAIVADATLIDQSAIANFETTTQLNVRDTNNRARANHTGTQPASTITGLATVATTGNYNELINKPDLSALQEVLPFANLAGFPAIGESGKVYIAEDTGYVYRWNGSGYTQLTDQTAIWGQIDGTLSNQPDLQNALNAKVTGNAAITPNTFPKITYDSKGLVTGGASLLATDIPVLPASKITSGTFADARISSSSVTQHLGNYVDRTTAQSIAGAKNFTTSIGLGVPTPSAKLHIDATSGNHIRLINTGSFGTITTTSGRLLLSATEDASEAVTITNVGDMDIGGIGTPTEKLDVTGNIRASGDIISNSDITLKENIQNLDSQDTLNKVLNLSGITYNLKSDEDKTRKIGYSAQNVEEYFPEFVHIDNQDIRSVDYPKMVAIMGEAIKELHKEIQELKKLIN